MEDVMKVSKWGNSLAIRLPVDLVEKLGVKEGDELYSIPGMSEEPMVKIAKKITREERLVRLAEFRKTVKWPEDYKFDRDEANSRGN
jgi:antitoxin MazE